MTGPVSCLYKCEVVHRRVHPVRHELRYRVYNVFIDVDELAEVPSRFRWLSYNRMNLLSISDRRHGPGDGTPIRDHAWSLARQAVCGHAISRIFMFCYPEVAGYVFNPLTVYYAVDAADRLRLMIYEVNNTFGQRHTYVIPVDEDGFQSCEKLFYVSPFNRVEGRYSFHFDPPHETMALGVNLSIQDRPILNAYVHGTRVALTDANLLRSFRDVPLLTLKVIGAIHWQALRLWWKGLRLQPRPAHAKTETTVLPPSETPT